MAADDAATGFESYNFANFTGDDSGEGGLAFRAVAPVGAAAPDVTLTRLDNGQSVQLSDFWRTQDVVIEFGSLT